MLLSGSLLLTSTVDIIIIKGSSDSDIRLDRKWAVNSTTVTDGARRWQRQPVTREAHAAAAAAAPSRAGCLHVEVEASSDLRLAGAEPSRSLLRSVAECGSPPRRRQFSHREALRQRVSLFLFRCSCSPLPALRLPRAEPRPPPPPPRKAIARHGKRDLPPLISLQTAPIRRARACGSRFPV